MMAQFVQISAQRCFEGTQNWRHPLQSQCSEHWVVSTRQDTYDKPSDQDTTSFPLLLFRSSLCPDLILSPGFTQM